MTLKTDIITLKLLESLTIPNRVCYNCIFDLSFFRSFTIRSKIIMNIYTQVQNSQSETYNKVKSVIL